MIYDHQFVSLKKHAETRYLFYIMYDVCEFIWKNGDLLKNFDWIYCMEVYKDTDGGIFIYCCGTCFSQEKWSTLIYCLLWFNDIRYLVNTPLVSDYLKIIFESIYLITAVVPIFFINVASSFSNCTRKIFLKDIWYSDI